MTTALLDLAAGMAQVGPVRLQVASASPPGAVSVVGCALRPVTLGERSRVVALARTAADPRQALAGLMLNLSVMGAPPQARVPAAMVALALAGAGTGERLPDFGTVAVEAARITGWDADTIEELPARDVDAIVAAQAGTLDIGAADTATQRILFVADEREAMAMVLADLADELLRRGAVVGGARAAAPACDPAAASADPSRPPAAVPGVADPSLVTSGGSSTGRPNGPTAQVVPPCGWSRDHGAAVDDTPGDTSHEATDAASIVPGLGWRASQGEIIPGPPGRLAASVMAARGRPRVTATVADLHKSPVAGKPGGDAAMPRPGPRPAARLAAPLPAAGATLGAPPATLTTRNRRNRATGAGAAAAAPERTWRRYQPAQVPAAADPGVPRCVPAPGDPDTPARQVADLERLADALGALLAGECDLRGLAP